MQNTDDNRSLWRFFDGSVSVSASMLTAIALNSCAFCDNLPLLGHLKELTHREDGIIIVATLLLFPTTAGLYGVFRMFFAAKEAAERKARARALRDRERGLQEGRREERERIRKALEQKGLSMPPELAKILADDPK